MELLADRDPEEAREQLAAPTFMFREIDMRPWLEPAEAEMKELAWWAGPRCARCGDIGAWWRR